jgi:hypothetical protein
MKNAAKLFFITLAILSIVLANLPLLLIVSRHTSSVWLGLFLHNPNQFLFLSAFFPVAVCLVSFAGFKLTTIFSEDLLRDHWLSKRMIPICVVFVSFGLAISVTSTVIAKKHEAFDFSDLRERYASAAVRSNRVALGWLQKGDLSYQNGLATIEGMPEVEDFRIEYQDEWKRRKELGVSSVLEKTSSLALERLLEARDSASAQELLEILDTVSGGSAETSIHHDQAIRYLQVVLDAELINAVLPHLGATLIDEDIAVANAIELGAVLFVVWTLIGLIALLLVTRNEFISRDTDLTPFLDRVTSMLMTSVALFAIWVGLRYYTMVEIGMVYGGDYPDPGEYIAAMVLIIAMAAYLAYVKYPTKVPKLLVEYWPLIVGIGTLATAYLSPIRASAIVGSNSNAYTLIAFLLVYCIILALWIVLLATSRKSDGISATK